jgi:hypothetical protein
MTAVSVNCQVELEILISLASFLVVDVVGAGKDEIARYKDCGPLPYTIEGLKCKRSLGLTEQLEPMLLYYKFAHYHQRFIPYALLVAMHTQYL